MPADLSAQSAFNKFQRIVDIETKTYKSGRSSRNFLQTRITALSKSDPLFPKITGRYIPYGSLARKTKIAPLDDIDLLVILSDKLLKEEAFYGAPYSPHTKRLAITNGTAPLAAYAENGYVNSKRILNRMKSQITKLHNYKYSSVKRNLQAVTLQLKTQTWNFDLVPAVAVGKVVSGKTVVAHYLIPDGKGEWMRTDPRKNATDTTAANRQHNGLLIPTIRLLKHWNRMTRKPRLSSFYFETLALRVFHYAPTITTIPGAVKYFFDHCPSYLFQSCPCPTGHGPNLDASVSWEIKNKVATAMRADANDAGLALQHEQQGDIKNALRHWRRVFGTKFPTYG